MFRKTLQRHLFSLLALVLLVVCLFSWWNSSREWTARFLETPIGNFGSYAESSTLTFSAKFMFHEPRWNASTSVDPISGDHMKFVWRLPSLRGDGYGARLFFIPHWQVAIGAIFAGAMALWWENSRLKKEQIEPSEE